jgi:hypothetical protein
MRAKMIVVLSAGALAGCAFNDPAVGRGAIALSDETAKAFEEY